MGTRSLTCSYPPCNLLGKSKCSLFAAASSPNSQLLEPSSKAKCLIRAIGRFSRVLTSPSQSIIHHDGIESWTGRRYSLPYTNSNTEYPVDRRTVILSAYNTSGRYRIPWILLYFASTFTVASWPLSTSPFDCGRKQIQAFAKYDVSPVNPSSKSKLSVP